jgi:uncharacterized repeat protein (TIGR03803 family)
MGLFAGLVMLCGAGRVQAQFALLHSFIGGTNDGLQPLDSLILSGSSLYGMTPSGGSGGGVVFKINTDGSGYTNVYNFPSMVGWTDIATPSGSPRLSGTELFGMTRNGGSGSNGVVFKVNTDGSGFTNLHSFTGGPNDGATPLGALTLSGMVLFGTTQYGGSSNNGVIFRLNTDGSGYTNLYSFKGPAVAYDAANPNGALVLSGTNLFGMTSEGGYQNQFGAIFRINTDGSGYTLLHTFTAGVAGAYPEGSLTMSGTNLFGMTKRGGDSNNGLIFRLNTDGSDYTNLYSFAGGANSGALPHGSLALSGTNLFGMTGEGGTSTGGTGVIFRINLDGSGFTNLHSFVGGANDGSGPYYSTPIVAGLKLYGMTPYGGLDSNGVVFALNLAPPAQLFFQDVGGQVASWLLAENGAFQSARLLGAAGGWRLRTVGDIDGDGISDLLFQDVFSNTGGWFLNADGSVRDARFWWNIGGWELKASGDYENLGRAQVFFQTAAGQVAYWRLDAAGNFLAAVQLGNQGTWELRGAGDLDGDHKAELFWQTAAGVVAIWFHDGPGGTIRGQLLGSTGEWALCGVTDVDTDGVCDLIWQTSDSRTGGWFMNTNGTARSANFWWPTGGWQLKAAGR